MKARSLHAVGAAALMALAALSGCKAKEAPDSGFLQDSHKMAPNEAVPFHRIYWNRSYDLKSYTEVMIAPVNIDYVMAQNVWEKATLANVSKEQIRKDLLDMATYTRQSFINAMQNDPQKRFKVVQTAGPRTLILETALIQLVPSKAVLNAVGYVTWIPGAVSAVGSAATGSEDSGKGVVAIEGRIRDGRTGEVIGMFADRESPAKALVDIKAVDWWAPAKSIVDQWALQLVALANRGPGQKVKDSSAFEFLVF